MTPLGTHAAVKRLVRLPFRLVPRAAVVPVLTGPMRGMKWVAGSAPHGAWLGTLERAKLRHFINRLAPGMIAWDIGANVGLYTLPSARAVSPAGRVHAFEPLPRNANLLRRHIALNRLPNVDVWEVAVGEVAGTLRMTEGDSPSEFRADPLGCWEVPAIALDHLPAGSGLPPPDVVKIDVEGSDDAVLRGGACMFARYRPLIYLALHGERQRDECGRLLVRWGYRIKSLEPGRDPEASDEWLAEST